MSDCLAVLENGFVHSDGVEELTLEDFFRQNIQGRSPSSGSREVALIVILDLVSRQIKVKTEVWVDPS